MTSEELRALDVRVWREVMGFDCWEVVCGNATGREWVCQDGDGGTAFVPPYSTDIAAAWRVVEKLGENGFNLWIEWKGKGRGYENTAEVSVNKVGGIDTLGHGVGSGPLAICLAALMAVEAKA